MEIQQGSGDGDRVVAASAPTGSAPALIPSSRPATTAARTPSIERLAYAPAADVWPEGSAPLARWLRANPEVIGELLGGTLTDSAEEVPGSDACLYDDGEGKRVLVVVELGDSTEGSFGTLVTRTSATRAGSALWICGTPRPEHLAAVSWLNRSVDTRFYIARLRAARIGASLAAPILDLVLRPGRVEDGGSKTTGTPERGRRAEDWREIALGEATG